MERDKRQMADNLERLLSSAHVRALLLGGRLLFARGPLPICPPALYAPQTTYTLIFAVRVWIFPFN
eukprot:5647585-Pyramimonas_sp.AAC.1